MWQEDHWVSKDLRSKRRLEDNCVYISLKERDKQIPRYCRVPELQANSYLSLRLFVKG